MSAINLSLADLKEAVGALSEKESADFDAWYVGSKNAARATPAAAAATKRPVTLEGAAGKQGETRPDGVLPPAAKKARLDGLGGEEEQGVALTDGVLSLPSNKKAVLDDEEGGEEGVAKALTFDKTPAKKRAQEHGAGGAKGGADSGSGGISAGGGATGAATKGVASAGGKGDVPVDEDSEDEDDAEGLQRKGGSSVAIPGQANGTTAEGCQEATEVVAAAGNGLNKLASQAPLPDPLQPLIDAVASGQMLQGNFYSLPAGAPARLVVQCPNPGCRTHFMPVHPHDRDGETSIPGFEYITVGIMDSPAFAAMNMGFYISRQAGGHGTWEVIFGVSEGSNGSGDSNPKRHGLSARVLANQRKYGHYGKWMYFADEQLDGEERHWGRSSKKGRVFKLYAFEAMVKRAYRMRAKAAVDNEVTSTEMCQFPSMREADECVLEIVGWMKDLIKDGTLTIRANVQDATEGNITIDLDEPKAPYYSFDNLVGQSACGGNGTEAQRQRHEEFQALVNNFQNDYSGIIAFIDRHGKKLMVVKKWLDTNIRPDEKWAALEEGDMKAFQSVGVCPFNWEKSNGFKTVWQSTANKTFSQLGEWQTRVLPHTCPPGPGANYFIADENGLVSSTDIALGTTIEEDLRRFRSDSERSDFQKWKYARYRDDYGLSEFGEDGSNQSSVVTMKQWLGALGITDHDAKLAWVTKLKVPHPAKRRCSCGTKPGVHERCLDVICVGCCKTHWVHPGCFEEPEGDAGWKCVVCCPESKIPADRSENEERKKKRLELKKRQKKTPNLDAERKRLKEERDEAEKETSRQKNSRAERAGNRWNR